MNIPRIFAHAFARKIAAVVVVAFLAWLGIGQARAQSTANCLTNDAGGIYLCASRADAYAGAKQAALANPHPHWLSITSFGYDQLTCDAVNDYCQVRYFQTGPINSSGTEIRTMGASRGWKMSAECAPGQEWFNATNSCAAACSSRPPEVTWMPPAGGHSKYCYNGCVYDFILDVAGNFAEPSGAQCLPTDAPPPLIDSDGDGEPDETDAFPNDPKETKDTDGDGIGDNADFSPDDEEDGKDDGEGDEKDNQASGGGTCDAAPTCKGDGIQCAQLFQQWKIRCQGTAQGKVLGDVQNCNSPMSVSSPDPVANAQLLVLRKIACNASSGTGNAAGDANGNGVADALEGRGSTGTDPATPDVEDFNFGIGPSMLDQENIFGGGSCPTVPSFKIWTVTINPSSMPYFCQMAAIMRALVLIFGMWTAVQILMGKYV